MKYILFHLHLCCGRKGFRPVFIAFVKRVSISTQSVETKQNIYEMLKKINREERILKMDIHYEQDRDVYMCDVTNT